MLTSDDIRRSYVDFYTSRGQIRNAVRIASAGNAPPSESRLGSDRRSRWRHKRKGAGPSSPELSNALERSTVCNHS